MLKSKRPLFFLLVFVIVILLNACNTTTGPVVIRDAETKHDAQDKTGVPAVVKPQKKQQASSKSELPLTSSLLAQSREKLQERDSDNAIALAERGLRIDRKEPQFYLILSKAYAQLENYQQSRYFARQGLRYVSKNSELYQELLILSQ